VILKADWLATSGNDLFIIYCMQKEANIVVLFSPDRNLDGSRQGSVI